MLLSQPVTELTTHVFLPVIEETAHRILRTLNLTEVIGDQIFIDTGFTAHSFTDGIDKHATFGPQAFRVEANIQLNPTSQKLDFYTFHHTAAYGIDRNTFRDPFPIYYDKENSIRIVEMRSPVSIMMNCELTLTSKELSWQAPQMIFNAFETGAVYELNDFVYDYPVPNNILSILYSFWKMDRRKGAQAHIKFMEYLNRNTQHGWQRRKHRDPKKNQWEIVVPVYDLQTIGMLEYSDDKPQPQMENKLPVGYSIPFVYTVQFAMPTLNLLHYHPVYNNQLVSPRMISSGTPKRFNNMEESRRSIDLQRYYECPKLGKQVYAQALRSPEYDDWTVPAHSIMHKFHQEAFFISCVTVDENETLETDLDYSQDFDPTFKLRDWVKEVLYQQGEESVEPSALLSVRLYRDNRVLLPYEDYRFTEDLHVKFKAVNLFSHYRVVFSEAMNWKYVHPKWYHLIRKFYPFLNSALKEQIRLNIEHHDIWCDPKWVKQVAPGSTLTLIPNGWIIDTHNHPIEHISRSTYPREVDIYGHHSPHRITRYGIIARAAH